MKIIHVFHKFNEFGGAEEHIVSLAELQHLGRHKVSVSLVQSSAKSNAYFQRLRQHNVPIYQWPIWISKLSGDWDTREAILSRIMFLLSPIILPGALLFSLVTLRPRGQIRKSIEGRICNIFKKFMNLQQEKKLFLCMLSLIHYKLKPDILHIHSYGSGLEYVVDWAYDHQVPTLFQEHSTPDLTIRTNYKLPGNLDKASLVVAVSGISAINLKNYCGVENTIKVIPPISMIETTKVTDKQKIDAKSEVQVLTIARLSQEKGLFFFIEAADLVRSQRPLIKFTIFGEGPMRNKLEEFIQVKQLTGWVKLPGSFPRQDLPEIMRFSDIFVLPSITEGLPLSVIEAMAFGMPIICTNVGGIPNLIKDGKNGLLCRAEDPSELAQAIIALIDDNKLRQKLGCEARLSYQQGPFHPEAICKKFDFAYKEAIQKNILAD